MSNCEIYITATHKMRDVCYVFAFSQTLQTETDTYQRDLDRTIWLPDIRDIFRNIFKAIFSSLVNNDLFTPNFEGIIKTEIIGIY